MLFQRRGLPSLPCRFGNVRSPISLRSARVLPHDEPCALARHSAGAHRMRSTHEAPCTAPFEAYQCQTRAYRHPMGGPLPFRASDERGLRDRLLPLYRPQSGPRRHGGSSVALPMVELSREQREWWSWLRKAAFGIPGARCRPSEPRCSLPRALRYASSAVGRRRYPECNSQRPPHGDTAQAARSPEEISRRGKW